MTRVVLFSSSAGDIPADLAFKNNFEATSAPGVNDDIAAGYTVGSTWVDRAGNVVYVCTDASAGAAVWVVASSAETTPGQVKAPDASTATGAGGAASLTGGGGGTTSGAGGTSSVVGGAAVGGNSAGGAAVLTGGEGHGTGAGGAVAVTGGASGEGATGNGGAVTITGGAAASTDGDGGSVVVTPGAKSGTGVDGAIRLEGLVVSKQGDPAAETVSATLTAAELLAGIITVNQGAGAPSTLTLPTGTEMQAALPADFAVDDSFDFSVINTSTVDAEDAAVAAGTDFTLVGSGDVPAHSGATLQSSGLFRARKTAANTFVAYRIA